MSERPGFRVSEYRGLPIIPLGRRQFIKRRFHGRGRDERMMRDRSFDWGAWNRSLANIGHYQLTIPDEVLRWLGATQYAEHQGARRT